MHLYKQMKIFIIYIFSDCSWKKGLLVGSKTYKNGKCWKNGILMPVFAKPKAMMVEKNSKKSYQVGSQLVFESATFYLSDLYLLDMDPILLAP